MHDLDFFVANYANTLEGNDHVFREFTQLTDSIEYLKAHKDFIQENKLGFGDRAFLYMWFLLLTHLQKKKQHLNILEIGVFKGQIISLWSLIAVKNKIDLKVNAISPLQGKPKDKSKLVKLFKFLSSAQYRKDIRAGNFYEAGDYRNIIGNVFANFGLDLSKVNLVQGFSNEAGVLERFKNERFDLVYIDGDHSYEGAFSDIKNYSPKINTGGFMVMDDASCNIPGSAFWKGHQYVSDACEMIDIKDFANVLNVGHNRVFQKQ